MSQNTKTLRVRIKSVNSTMQLTNAMGLVASSKIRRANESMLKAREYLKSLNSTAKIIAKIENRAGVDNIDEILVDIESDVSDILLSKFSSSS